MIHTTGIQAITNNKFRRISDRFTVRGMSIYSHSFNFSTDGFGPYTLKAQGSKVSAFGFVDEMYRHKINL